MSYELPLKQGRGSRAKTKSFYGIQNKGMPMYEGPLQGHISICRSCTHFLLSVLQAYIQLHTYE